MSLGLSHEADKNMERTPVYMVVRKNTRGPVVMRTPDKKEAEIRAAYETRKSSARYIVVQDRGEKS